MDWEDKKKIVWANAGNFEWSQTIDDVKIRIQFPPTTTSKNVDYALKAGSLRVGLKGFVKLQISYFSHESVSIHRAKSHH
jgi:hypothetical protein